MGGLRRRWVLPTEATNEQRSRSFSASIQSLKERMSSRRVIFFTRDSTICRGYSSGVRIARLSAATITLHDARSTDDRTRLPTVTTWGPNDCRGHLLQPPPSMSPFNLKSSSAYTAGVRRTAKFRADDFLHTTQPQQLPCAGSSTFC